MNQIDNHDRGLEADRERLDLRSHLSAVTRFWRSLVALTLLGVVIAGGYSVLAQPTYQSNTTYFVATSADRTNTALQADEFAQRRINSYVGVINSDRLAEVVLNDTGLPLTVADIEQMVSATADPETVLLTVTVTDISAQRAQVVAESISKNLDATIGSLDNRRTSTEVEIRTISGPSLLPYPVTPRTRLNLAIGLLLGLSLGVAQALIRQQLDPTFRSRNQLEKSSGVPVLGWLPFDRTAKASPILASLADHSRRAETFRQLRTNLRFVDAASPIEVLTVTSAVEGEGKTTTATNLALSFAHAGRRTLLLDGDLRKPKLARYLDLEGSAGVTNVLIGDAELADVVQDFGEHGLQVLASGPIPPNPSELLGSVSMEKLIQQARITYDLVIIDTPPLLPVTDAAVTATSSDGVLLVVRYGRTRIDQVLQSIASLRSVDARVLGTVVSMTKETRRQRRSSYYVSETP